ncbi:DODA-type extradiol aromatic ring-opening family dioxygenase [Photobacterium atrarenae]|uniref:Dioxygenase n=1 Tax=Photobacterium atrarenae TaxID=865757 RepID=A0ABY5GQA2_9GAMM|nr:class III extradiol ring-cleavage dioxygenase [Photobacterium atrarenae]UTV31000.1 dioxygenase [Photobacterium atrarenae]
MHFSTAPMAPAHDPRADQITQPVMFIPHGAGPCFFMAWEPTDTWDAMAEFLKGVAATLPARPRAILMISAHWQSPGFRVISAEHPHLKYDYFGFPDHTYQLTYPAPGSPALAAQITRLLTEAGLDCQPDDAQRFDHGMFIPLKLMFPEADIPVVQLSLRRDYDAAAHLAAGQALTSLRDEGVLIIGSGMSFHNMRGYGDPRYTAPSKAFDDWLTLVVGTEPYRRSLALRQWDRSAPYAQHCHPPGAEEHLIPLMVAAGAAGKDLGHKVYSEEVLKTRLSAFRFG